MKSKSILSLVMAAAVTLGGAAIATNANFNATATSNGNTITMGTVQLGNINSGEVGQTINMDTLFNVSNLGTLTDPVTQSRKIVIRGSLPVTLSLGTYTNNENRVFEAANPSGLMPTWWRHFKSNIVVSVTRAANGRIDSYTSRPDTLTDGFDSIFDTIEGATHNPTTENTTGLNSMLSLLGTLYPGDIVTITTKNKFAQTAYYTQMADKTWVNGPYTLTQDEVNAFQGKSLYVNLKLVATEAK